MPKKTTGLTSHLPFIEIATEGLSEKLDFLNRVQKNAPVDLNLSILFAGIKIGNLDFLSLYTECMEVTSTSTPSWKVFRRAQRALILAQYFDYALSIPGLYAECGIFRGFSVLLLNLIAQMRDLDWDGDSFYLIDSFEGLSQPQPQDAIGFRIGALGEKFPILSSQAGHFATPLNIVQENLGAFPKLNFYKGWIPIIFNAIPEKKWSFVHIDVDLHQPTFDCLDYFYPRMAPGGVIINDDFSSPLFPGGGTGWKKFFEEKKESYIVLDTGQAVFINH
jgi:O-methyltransferase